MPEAPETNVNTAPDWVRFCARCGEPMTTALRMGQARRVCTSCGHVHYTDPKVGVGVLVMDAGQVLLVRRGVMPEKGKWSLPAGFVDAGDDPPEKAAREVLEEAGLIVSIDGLLDVYHNPSEQGGASIFILYRGRVLGGRLQAGDDATEARFFSLSELPELAFTSTRHALSLLGSD